jgi:hypothetical protein
MGGFMANLSIRNLEDRLHQALQARAAEHGVSMEEEARQILRLAIDTPKDISQVFNKFFGENGIILDSPTHPPHDPLEF